MNGGLKISRKRRKRRKINSSNMASNRRKEMRGLLNPVKRQIEVKL